MKRSVVERRDRAAPPFRRTVRRWKVAASMRVQHVQQRVGPVVESKRERRGDGWSNPDPADGDKCLRARRSHEAERLSEVQNIREPLQRVLGAVRKVRMAEKALQELEAGLEPSVCRDRDGGMPMDAPVAVSSAPLPGAGRQERGWERRYSGAGP